VGVRRGLYFSKFYAKMMLFCAKFAPF